MLLKLCSAYGDLHMQIRIYRLRLGSNCQFRKKKLQKKVSNFDSVVVVQQKLGFFISRGKEIFSNKKINPFELRQTKTSFMFQ